MKRVVSLILCFSVIMILFASCGKTETAKTVSMYDLSKAMVSASDKLSDMAYASSSDSNPEEVISNVADVDYEQIDAFFISYAENGAESADEIVVIAAKSEDYAVTVKASLQKHLDYRVSLYKTYGAEQLPKLEKAKIFTDGIYAVLIVADDTEAINKAFELFTA